MESVQTDQEMYETDPKKIKHFVALDINMETTKVLSGVPIYNYHLIHAGGMHPSELELATAKDWLIDFPSKAEDANGWGDADIRDGFCAKAVGNSHCLFQGHPDENGIDFADFHGTETELEATLAQRPQGLARPKFAEGDQPVTAIPEVPEDDHSGELLIEANPGSWGLDRIDDAVGLDSDYSTPAVSRNGEGAHVYVADTGINFHHDEFEGRALPAWDAFGTNGMGACDETDTTCAFDRQSHGTHCAGTVGGKTVGVAKKVALYSAKVLSDQGSGSNS